MVESLRAAVPNTDIKKEFNAVKREKFIWCSELAQNASKNALHN